jgi:undecaprenyl-diphosphatase UppP
VIGVLVAFLPAVVVGLAVGKYIKELLFNPWVVCFTLIVGGAILLWVDQLDLKPHEDDATRYPLLMYLWIGIAQCVAMIPGVSRSGASIVAAMLLGADKRSAAEFSFFLAIPTMVGAFAYDFYKNRGEMTVDHYRRHRDRIRGVVHHGDDRGEDIFELRHPPRVHVLCVVARHRRHARPDRAGDWDGSFQNP